MASRLPSEESYVFYSGSWILDSDPQSLQFCNSPLLSAFIYCSVIFLVAEILAIRPKGLAEKETGRLIRLFFSVQYLKRSG